MRPGDHLAVIGQEADFEEKKYRDRCDCQGEPSHHPQDDTEDALTFAGGACENLSEQSVCKALAKASIENLVPHRPIEHLVISGGSARQENHLHKYIKVQGQKQQRRKEKVSK